MTHKSRNERRKKKVQRWWKRKKWGSI